MTKRLESFRVGDRREAIALAYLRCLGFVAPVPREEDVGLDALVTLSELQQGLNYPRETFCVQIKPTSYDALYFGREHFDWFASLASSLFFVARDQGKMFFYSTSRLWTQETPLRLLKRKPHWLWFRAGPAARVDGRICGELPVLSNEGPDQPRGRKFGLKKGMPEPPMSLMLGAPIVAIDESKLEDSLEYRSKVVDIIRRHVQLENRGRVLSKLSVQFLLEWQTNCLPQFRDVSRTADPIEKTPVEQMEVVLAGLHYVELSLANELSEMTSEGAVPAHIAGLAEFMDWLHSRNIKSSPSHLADLIRQKGLRDVGGN